VLENSFAFCDFFKVIFLVRPQVVMCKNTICVGGNVFNFSGFKDKPGILKYNNIL